MLQRASELKKCRLNARDGTIGKIKDLLFDDEAWTIRYLVANTSRWLPGRRVLLSPLIARGAAITDHKLPVDLTKTQIQQSPGIDADAPLSAQYQKELHAYYGWAAYWSVEPYPMAGIVPPPLTPSLATVAADTATTTPASAADPNLRSANEVAGDKIQASDGEIGHVDDFLIDVSDWMVRFIVVDTKNWIPGKKVVITTAMIDRISWTAAEVAVSVPRHVIQESPEYFADQPLAPDYEQQLAAYYDGVAAHP